MAWRWVYSGLPRPAPLADQVAAQLREQARQRAAVIVAVGAQREREWQAAWGDWRYRAPGIYGARREDVERHIFVCLALSQHYRVTMDPGRLWGETERRLRKLARHRARQRAGRRGRQALIARYGLAAADAIIARSRQARHAREREAQR